MENKDGYVVAEVSTIKLEENEKISSLDFTEDDINYFSYNFWEESNN